jgi:hypothetical protein
MVATALVALCLAGCSYCPCQKKGAPSRSSAAPAAQTTPGAIGVSVQGTSP